MSSYGCYGFALDGLDNAAPLLPLASSEAPAVRVVRTVGCADGAPEEVLTADRAHLRLADRRSVATVDRATATVELTVVTDYPDEQIVHPFLSGSAAVLSRWARRDPFHAGGFVNSGRAWIVLGDKGLGKSSLLAALNIAGLRTVSDDLIVVDGATVFGGPGFIDLRPDAAGHLGIGTSIGRVGARERSRYYFDPPEFAYPLGGWVTLRWGAEVAVDTVAVRDRLTHLYENSAVRRAPVDPAAFLQHISRPFHVLTRPRDWQSLTDSVAALRRATE